MTIHSYPDGFTGAVLPPEVNPNNCDHDAVPPECHCVHDWRILNHWGNETRKPKSRPRYVTDSP